MSDAFNKAKGSDPHQIRSFFLLNKSHFAGVPTEGLILSQGDRERSSFMSFACLIFQKMCVKTLWTSAVVTLRKNKNNNNNHTYITLRSVTTQTAKCSIFSTSSSPNRRANAQSLSGLQLTAATCRDSILPSG